MHKAALQGLELPQVWAGGFVLPPPPAWGWHPAAPQDRMDTWVQHRSIADNPVSLTLKWDGLGRIVPVIKVVKSVLVDKQLLPFSPCSLSFDGVPGPYCLAVSNPRCTTLTPTPRKLPSSPTCNWKVNT